MIRWLAVVVAFLFTFFACLVSMSPQTGRAEAVYRNYPTSAWVQALQSPDETVRSEAATALGELGSDARTAVPALTTALNDRDRRVRLHAAHSLGQIGSEAKAAVPLLRQSIVHCKDGPALRETLTAIRRIEGRADARAPAAPR